MSRFFFSARASLCCETSYYCAGWRGGFQAVTQALLTISKSHEATDLEVRQYSLSM